jgi:hypothetical protein
MAGASSTSSAHEKAHLRSPRARLSETMNTNARGAIIFGGHDRLGRAWSVGANLFMPNLLLTDAGEKINTGIVITVGHGFMWRLRHGRLQQGRIAACGKRSSRWLPCCPRMPGQGRGRSRALLQNVLRQTTAPPSVVGRTAAMPYDPRTRLNSLAANPA